MNTVWRETNMILRDRHTNTADTWRNFMTAERVVIPTENEVGLFLAEDWNNEEIKNIFIV